MIVRSDRSDQYTEQISVWFSILILAQPMLDVLSYWLGQIGRGEWLSLGLRMLLLAGTLVIAFLLSERKTAYWLLLIVLAAFWGCHALICMRIGYQSPVSDFVNYARVAQIPLLTFCLITFLRCLQEPFRLLERLLTWSLYFIFAVTVIAALSGTTVYSYTKWNVGYSGWFALPNCQSAIYGVLTVFSVFAALDRSDWLRAGIRCLVGFSLLYFLGTRLAYAEIFLIAVSVPISMLLAHRFDWRAAVLILVLALLFGVFYSKSPMTVNRRLYQESVDEQQQTADNSALSTDALYEKYMSAMVDRFGIDAVKEVYHNTRDISVIGDVRLYKINYCKMVMSELPAESKWFGFELAETWHQGSIFDVENDYHGVYFLYGMVGLGLLIGFLLFFAGKALIGLFHNDLDSGRMWLFSSSLASVILIVNAGFSASVLRRPNASFYLSLTLAVVWALTARQKRRVS